MRGYHKNRSIRRREIQTGVVNIAELRAQEEEE